jgi:hypothetical protein
VWSISGVEHISSIGLPSWMKTRRNNRMKDEGFLGNFRAYADEDGGEGFMVGRIWKGWEAGC